MGTCERNIVKIDSESGSNSRDDDSSESSSKEEDDTDSGTVASVLGYAGASLVVVGSPIPHPSNIEVPLGRQTFLSKHSLNMKFTYADERLAEHLGWASDELLGKSVFEFHHALDNSSLDKSFKSLFSKGQCETMAYRFLSKNGGYAWVVTQATVIHCSKLQKPISVVCVNHVLSGVECENEVYSERQLEARKASVTLNTSDVSSIDDYENVKSTTNRESSPCLILDTPSPTDTDDSCDKTSDEKIVEATKRENGDDFTKKILVTRNVTRNDESTTRRPLIVTSSLFRSQADLENSNSRKDSPDNALTARGTKNLNNRRERANWFFQDKPILEHEQSRNNRPQAVTRNVFVPLGLIQDQELSQQNEATALACRPQTTTASIFAPRTEDMNKGFLTFSEDQPGLTMLKDEPEDLTHLAPTPGDVCVPLEDTPFLSEMLDEFILGNENYCPLLSPEELPTELPNSVLNDSIGRGNNEICGESIETTLADSDPFIYRDIPSPCSLSPDLISSSGNGKSPDRNSLGSLQSPKRSDELVDGIMTIGSVTSVGNPINEDEMLMLSINDVIGDEELALRAPYIPMSDQDEALQLLISDDTVMWGPSQSPDKKAKWHREEEKPISKRREDSNLARLLRNDACLAKYNDHGGGLVDPAQIFGRTAEKGTKASSFERPSKRVHATISQSLASENKRSRLSDTGSPPPSSCDSLTGCDVTSILKNSTTRDGNCLNYDEQSIDLCDILDTSGINNENYDKNSFRQPESRLLQQLMSHDRRVASTSDERTRRDSTSDDGTNLLKIIASDVANLVETSRIENNEKMDFSGDGGGSETNYRGKRRSNGGGSVLMNLLVSGCDKSTGTRTTPSRLSDKWSKSLIAESTRNSDDGDLDFYDAEYSVSSDDRNSSYGNYFIDDSTGLGTRRCRYIRDA